MRVGREPTARVVERALARWRAVAAPLLFGIALSWVSAGGWRLFKNIEIFISLERIRSEAGQRNNNRGQRNTAALMHSLSAAPSFMQRAFMHAPDLTVPLLLCMTTHTNALLNVLQWAQAVKGLCAYDRGETLFLNSTAQQRGEAKVRFTSLCLCD